MIEFLEASKKNNTSNNDSAEPKLMTGLEEEVQELRRENFLLKQVINNLPGSIYWKTKEGVYLGNNNYAKTELRTMGYHNVDPIGKTDFELFSQEAAEQFRKNDLEVLQSQQEVIKEETCPAAEGKLLTRLSSKKPLYDMSDEVIGIVGNTIDITHLKETEENLRKAKVQAEAANKAKTAFIRNISHDIRTPLVGSIGGAQLIVEQTDNSDIKQLAEHIAISNNHLLKLINDVIDASRFEMDLTEEVINKFSIREILEELRGIFVSTLFDRDISLRIVIDEATPKKLLGNNTVLQRILLNLLSNAVKFTEAGSITLNAEVKSISEKIINMSFSVTDTGIGIPTNKLNDIFEPFQKLSASYKNQYPGSGLGLFCVKEYVNQLAGEIFVTSTENSGTTFTCEIPFEMLTEQEEAATTDAQSNQQKVFRTPDKKYTILLVEDNFLARRVAEKLLGRYYFRVVAVENAQSAIKALKNQTFDLIYMDLGLPDGDGASLTHSIRKNKANHNCNVPIVALTAHADKEIIEQCLAAGMQTILDKPINIEKIDAVHHDFFPIQNEKQKPIIDLKLGAKLVSSDETAAKEMIQMLVQELSETEKELHQAFEQKNWQMLKNHAHKLHGALHYCGTPRLKHAASALELQKSDHALEYQKNYDHLLYEIHAVINEFKVNI